MVHQHLEPQGKSRSIDIVHQDLDSPADSQGAQERGVERSIPEDRAALQGEHFPRFRQRSNPSNEFAPPYKLIYLESSVSWSIVRNHQYKSHHQSVEQSDSQKATE